MLQGQIPWGFPVSLLGPQAGKPHMRFSSFTTVGGLLFSSLWVMHLWQVWDLILLWSCPSYHPSVAYSLSLDMGYIFLVDSSILLSKIVQQLVLILLLLQEEMSAHHSTPPSLTGFSEFTYFFWNWIYGHYFFQKVIMITVSFN